VIGASGLERILAETLRAIIALTDLQKSEETPQACDIAC